MKCKMKCKRIRKWTVFLLVVLAGLLSAVSYQSYQLSALESKMVLSDTILENALIVRTDTVALKLFREYDLELNQQIDWKSIKINACRDGKRYACEVAP